MTGACRRAAVLGHPIAHSLSPVLHRAAYRAMGLTNWRYDAVDVESDGLKEFIDTLDDSWAGLSLTMPLKQTVLPLLDHIEPLAQIVGAVNTVVFQVAGARTLIGANTDVYGLVAALREVRPGRLEDRAGSGVVVGGGATAASAIAALAELGCTQPVVLVRSPGRTGPLQRAAHRMGLAPRVVLLRDAVQHLRQADAVISTLPAGAADGLAGPLGTGDRLAGALVDVVYDPRPTRLLTAWKSAGGAGVGGERMLLHQAVEQVRLMTGIPAPVAAMESALLAALDQSS